MAGIQDLYDWIEDFNGAVATLPTSADPATPWMVDDTSVTGTPTYTKGTSLLTMALNNDNAVVNICTHFNDALDFNINLIQSIEMRVRINAATFTSGSTLVFGLGSARADDPDTVAANAWFRMEGANSTTRVYCETDDGTRDVDDINSGVTLGTTFKRFVIDFAHGKGDVQFYIEGQRVAASQLFNMSGYNAGLQPIIQLQKAANTNADSVIVDYIKITMKRA